MKAVYMTAWVGIVALGMAIFVAFAGAAPNAPSPAPAPTADKAEKAPAKAEMPACPMCPMMAGGGKGMGKEMDMTPGMKQRCRMMMNAEMCKDDAACLLACKQDLKLTPEQVQKLEQIVKDSRQAAAAILTPEQQKTLAEVAAQPTSMCAMHEKMHEKMIQKAGPKPEEKAKTAPEAAAPKAEEKAKTAPEAAAPKAEEKAKTAPEAAAPKAEEKAKTAPEAAAPKK